MEENCMPCPPPSPSAADIACNHELTRSNSNASALTAENCLDTYRRSENATPVDCTAWTNEKHNLYLRQLEVSFVKQLHQRKCLFTRCSDQNQRDLNVSGEGLIHVNTASEQLNVLRNGFEQKIDCVRGKYLATSTSADRHASLKSKLLYDCEHMDVHRPPPSAETQEILKLCSRMKRGKRTISHCSTSCSKELSSTNPHHVVLFDLHKEGTGQNFLNDDNQCTSNIESQTKRSKTALADSSSQDQIVPFGKCSTLGEELPRHESVSEKLENFICTST